MKKSLLFFIMTIFYQQAVIPENLVETAVIDLKEQVKKEFEDLIAKAKRKLNALKEFQDFKTILKKGGAEYEYSKISLIDSEKDGIIMDFGYSGYGYLSDGFKGFNAKVRITDMPGSESWGPAIEAALRKLGLGFLIDYNPAQEGLTKLMLLCKDRARNMITPGEFVYNLNGIMIKFVKTPKYNSMTSIFQDASGPLNTVLGTISLKSKLESYYTKIGSLLNRQFPKKTVNGHFVENPGYKKIPATPVTLTDKQALWMIASLNLNGCIFYSDMVKAFEETPAGKAALKVKKDAFNAADKLPVLQRPGARIAAIKAYNRKLPGFGSVDDNPPAGFTKATGFSSTLVGFLIVEHMRIGAKNAKMAKNMETIWNKSGLKALTGIDGKVLTSALREDPPAEPAAPEEPVEEFDESLADLDIGDDLGDLGDIDYEEEENEEEEEF